MTDPDITDFAAGLQKDLLAEATASEEDRTIRDVFVERMVGELSEVGELEDGMACFYQAKGIEVAGYNVSQDGHLLDLFGVVLTQEVPPPTVLKVQIDTCVRRLRGFLDRAIDSRIADNSGSKPVSDMFLRIRETWVNASQVRLFVFTDGISPIGRAVEISVDEVPVSVNVWDLRRLQRLVTSGRKEEPVNIDFLARFGTAIPCLATERTGSDYRTILAILPGDVLMDIYGEYGSRVLELNVRSFLQARGKVNQGIRRTIIDMPDRFLAYNNGISATASAVELTTLPEGGLGIRSVSNLQIVNGGQTTASLYHSAVKDRANIDSIHVQMKLTVVEPGLLEEIVPLISRYANSQNKVDEADFSANHPFHVEIEKLSRTVWALAPDVTQRQTRWFYERARGQYQDALFRAGSAIKQRQFKELNPAGQRFTKTDLSKYILAWDRLPHVVSLGAQKCFREFSIGLSERNQSMPDQSYYEALIAKAVIFRRTEGLVSSLKLGGYRANVVAYVMALLSERSEGLLDLRSIWQLQGISRELEGAILDLAPRIHRLLLEAPGRGNVTEWAKKSACWDRVRNMAWQLPSAALSDTMSSP